MPRLAARHVAVAAVVCLPLASRAADCNGNGAADGADIAAGTSRDCNQNAVPDECEGAPLGFAGETYPLGSSAELLAAGDLNGDGRPDLLVWEEGDGADASPGLAALLNRGSREFQRVLTPAAVEPRELFTADLDGDRTLDAFLNATDGLAIFPGAGTGLFRQRLIGPLFSLATILRTGDLDQDGDLDLLGARSSSDALQVAAQESAFQFAPLVESPLPGGAQDLALADADADGDLDVLALARSGGDVSLLPGDGRGGLGAATVAWSWSDEPDRLLATDLDLDGRGDLAVAGRPGAAVGHAIPGGAWGQPREYLFSEAQGRVSALEAGDFDGDGRLDLFLGRNDAAGGPTIVLGGRVGRLESSSALGPQGLAGPGTVADLDGDLLAEVTGIAAGGKDALVLWNDPSQPPIRIALEAATRGLGYEPHALASADLDQDGDADLALIDGEVSIHILRNDGAGALDASPEVRLQGASEIISLAAGDLDQDGDMDLAVAEETNARAHVAFNLGDGRFLQGPSPAVGNRASWVATADFTGDGLLDIATANPGGPSISLLRGIGGGAFETASQMFLNGSPPAIAAGDLDQDGGDDLVAVATQPAAVWVFWNSGQVSLRDFPRTQIPATGAPSNLAIADVIGDPLPDICVASLGADGISILANQGGRAFTLDEPILRGTPSFSVVAPDLSGDGLRELAGVGAAQLHVSTNLGGGRFSPPRRFPVGQDPRYAIAADLDMDRDQDIVVSNHTSMNLSIFTNASPPVFDRSYLERVCTPLDFHNLSLASPPGGLSARSTKYVAPATDDPSLLGVVFQNVRRHPLHVDFLADVFPDRFPALTPEAYDQLTGRRATRKYFAGVVHQVRTDDGLAYGFNVLADFLDDPRELPTLEEVRGVYTRLKAAFALEPLAYYPDTSLALEAAKGWAQPGFPVLLLDATAGSTYRLYTRGTTYGRVRLLTHEQFLDLNDRGGFSFQDILVLERAPRDIEGVVAGVITAEPQAELSHLAVRTARRGSPNAYVAGALLELTAFSGKLVRLETHADGYEIELATPGELAAWWAEHRPRLSERPVVDAVYTGLDSLAEMDLSAAARPESRYGGKASNFGRLQRLLSGEWSRYGEVGFAIPMSYYLDFLRSNRIESIHDPLRSITYEEFLDELHAWPQFLSDSELRFEVLDRFREAMEDDGAVPESLVARIAARIGEVFGDPRLTVRFRSSSNVEDALEFNGAGLYDSTSACAADDLDADGRGPSLCDATRDTERGIARALKRVWASLWNFRAVEERAYYGIDHHDAAMGILVSRAFLDERAGGVAFTGNPTNASDRRYVITAQQGEASVVSPEPGELPEKSLLEVEGGKVVKLLRVQASTLVPAGSFVLSDDELRELGALLAHVDRNFPIELGEHARQDVLLDFEFKITPAGAVGLKQVRPFLVGSGVPRPTFTLEIPEGAMACGAFVPTRAPLAAYELKSTLRFVPGQHLLPARQESFPLSLIGEVLVGPERQVGTPVGPGTMRVTLLEGKDSIDYRFHYSQSFQLGDGGTFVVEIPALSFEQPRDAPAPAPLLLTGDILGGALPLQGRRDESFITYGSCDAAHLPRWDIAVELAGGSRIDLVERHRPPAVATETGPAALVGARLLLEGKAFETTDYWRLVYSSLRHNRSVKYWVTLEAPVVLSISPVPVNVIEIIAPEPRQNVEAGIRYHYYADGQLTLIGGGGVASFTRSGGEPELRRGDADASGAVDIADAIVLLRHLFQGGATPACADAGDANDDGALNLTDPVAILRHLFQGGGPLPAPADACGSDPTADALDCAGPCAPR